MTKREQLLAVIASNRGTGSTTAILDAVLTGTYRDSLIVVGTPFQACCVMGALKKRAMERGFLSLSVQASSCRVSFAKPGCFECSAMVVPVCDLVQARGLSGCCVFIDATAIQELLREESKPAREKVAERWLVKSKNGVRTYSSCPTREGAVDALVRGPSWRGPCKIVKRTTYRTKRAG